MHAALSPIARPTVCRSFGWLAGVRYANSRHRADRDARREPARERQIEMVLRVQGVGPGQPRTLVVPYALLLADPELDPEPIQGKGFRGRGRRGRAGALGRDRDRLCLGTGASRTSPEEVVITGQPRWPRPGDHPAIELDVAVDHDGQGELLVDPPSGRRRRAGGPPPGLRAIRGWPPTRPRRSGSSTRRPCPAVVDQVGVAGDPRDHAGQGGRHRLQERIAHPFGHAGQDERSAARR